MNGLTLRHLRYFIALARHRHFGRAAQACSVSQPALSVQIKELEALFGATLIERSARQTRLTPLGEELEVRASDILRAVDELGDLARAAQDPFAGRLRIGVIPTIAPYLLPQLIAAIGAGFPRLDIRPRETVTQTLIHELNEGRLDAAVMALPVSEPALHEEDLFAEDFVLVRPRADAGKPVPDAEALREMRLLLLEEGHCFRDQALSFCNLGSPPPRDMMEGSSLSTLVQMVGAGIGVTLIPEMAVEIETRSAPVSIARLAAPPPRRRVGMVWRKSSSLADSLTEIVARLRPILGNRQAGQGRSGAGSDG
ncbi:hydrogen peroxide-inducible genes activator [Frigidibacter sp. ROC022]|uniref:hydrogen peroxide-inducible genes activator n=1 Tax=Frigidibacter sp. ROC022 TaxID=2971796 RepID=UPI00215A5F7F|nr:hydrogen peroxide-inducible genes activator [Frigidibacter sp. ROC022]MCR8726099.1 hydrogen peroxide-inducible genes activator [Frigidibacter sp. ROC022]